MLLACAACNERIGKPLVEESSTRVTVKRTGGIGWSPSGEAFAYVSNGELVRNDGARVKLLGTPCTEDKSATDETIALSRDGKIAIVFGTRGRWVAVACKVDFERKETQRLADTYPGLAPWFQAGLGEVRIVFGESGALYVWRPSDWKRPLMTVRPEDPRAVAQLTELPGSRCEIVERGGTISIGCIDRVRGGLHRIDRRVIDLSSPFVARVSASKEIAIESYNASAMSRDGKRFAFITSVPARHLWESTQHVVGLVDLDHLDAEPVMLPFDVRWSAYAVAVLPSVVLVSDGGNPNEYGIHALRQGAKERIWRMPASAVKIVPAGDGDEAWLDTLDTLYRFHP
jgi:hypothetical protein